MEPSFSSDTRAAINRASMEATAFTDSLIEQGKLEPNALTVGSIKIKIAVNDELHTADFFLEPQEGSGYPEGTLIAPSLVEGDPALFFQLPEGATNWEYERTDMDSGWLWGLNDEGKRVAYVDYVPGKIVGADWTHGPKEGVKEGSVWDWSDEVGSWVSKDKEGVIEGVWVDYKAGGEIGEGTWVPEEMWEDLVNGDEIVMGNGGVLTAKDKEGETSWIRDTRSLQWRKVEEKPVATETVEDEHDLRPHYVETVDREYKGVHIHAELITDESVSGSIEKVTVTQGVFAEFVARTIFETWWTKGSEGHKGVPTREDLNAFMELWKKAQETNDPADWEKVALHDIYANDLNDGIPYHNQDGSLNPEAQKPYTIWPMYFGDKEPPEGIKGIDNFAVVVAGSRIKNITINDKSDYGSGSGTNLDGKILYVYRDAGVYKKMSFVMSKIIAGTGSYLRANKGNNHPSSLLSINYLLTKILRRGLKLILN